MVSFSSPDRFVVITGCVAGFPGGDMRSCVKAGDVWSVTLQVPSGATAGPLGVGANILYTISNPDGGLPGETTVTVPFTVVLPTTTSGRPPTTTGPSPTTTGSAPTTVTPSTAPEPVSTSGGTGNLWILVVVLVLLLLALTAALAVRRSRRRARPPERVQLRLRNGPVAAPRIEQISERPAWVLRIDPHHGRATERVEEMQR